MAFREPPGPKGFPLIGNAFAYARDPLGFVTRCARTYGDVVALNFPGYGGYLLNHPDDIETLLRGRAKDYIKDKFISAAVDVLGNGLLSSEGDIWRKQRKMIAPYFQLEQIRHFGVSMIDHAERRIDEWKAGEVRDVHSEAMRITLEIIGSTLFDIELGAEAERLGHTIDSMMEIFLNPLVISSFYRGLPLPQNIRYHRGVDMLNELAYRRIREKRAAGTVGAKDLLSKMIEACDEDGKPMSDSELRDQLLTFILAGHETTALTLSYAFYLLGMNPDAETKLIAEIKEKIGDRPPTVEDYPNFEYARWVIKESMRLYPPAWSISRESLVETAYRGYRFPKGTNFMVAQWVTQRDSRWFDNPDEFIPDRWANDFEKKVPRGAYFPFGDGPRICIGQFFAVMEAVLILVSVYRRFRLELVDKGPLELIPSLTVRPKNGIKATLIRD